MQMCSGIGCHNASHRKAKDRRGENEPRTQTPRAHKGGASAACGQNNTGIVSHKAWRALQMEMMEILGLPMSLHNAPLVCNKSTAPDPSLAHGLMCRLTRGHPCALAAMSGRKTRHVADPTSPELGKARTDGPWGRMRRATRERQSAMCGRHTSGETHDTMSTRHTLRHRCSRRSGC